MLRNRLVIIFIFLLLIILIFRLISTIKAQNKISADVIITASLDSQPKISGQSQIFKIANIWVITRRFPELNFGDRVKIEGRLEEGRLFYPKLELIDVQEKDKFRQFMFNLRKRLTSTLSRFLPEPQASLAIGMVLGLDQIPKEFASQLKRTGTLHVVVVSGQNVTLVAGFIMALTAILKRRLAIGLTLIAIFFYTFLAGAEPPIIRAAIMGSLAYFGQFLGRATWGLFSLALTAFVMLVIEPLLIFNISFILSFAATFGILLFGPIFVKLLPKLVIFSEEIAITAAAWLMTLPILAYNFGQASIVAIFANILIAVVIIPIMILGFISAIVGTIIGPLGQIIAWIAYVPLSYFVMIVNLFAKFPFASVSFERFSIFWIFGYYIISYLLILWLTKSRFQVS